VAHSARNNIHRLPANDRVFRPSPAELLRRAGYRPTLFERISDALGYHPFLIGLYLGFYAGCMATVVLALIWARVL
jgi:hypothetical protein